MITLLCLLILPSLVHASGDPVKPAAIVLHAGDESATSLKLTGSDARHQLLVTAKLPDGSLRDVTREVKYSVEPASVARVTEQGVVVATGNGSAFVNARTPDGLATSLSLTIEHVERIEPINFVNSVVPVFTKGGCNGGGCHGKLAGQNGFRLSLLGFEPQEDYEHLVKESRGRRLFPAAPEHSLLLTKGTGAVPHGGGKRMEVGGDDYRLLVRWMAQGMPVGRPEDPSVTSVEVFPSKRLVSRGASQQLLVLAKYSDGTTQDVTRSALFEPNAQEMAGVDPAGFVKVADQPGDVAVMVRYQGKVATFRATVPLGAPMGELPVAKNFIDELVFKKLKEIGMPPSKVCDDATFVRRVSIDVTGTLPTPEQVTAFVNDATPGKRDRLIDALLDGPGYADYFANKWSALLRNKRAAKPAMRGTFTFYGWLRDSLAANKPYDQIVREILTASGDVETNPPVAWYGQVKEPQGQLEDTAQLFLGMRLQCAQCHHHPYEKWSQQDYFSFSAFFSRVGRKGGDGAPNQQIVFHRRGQASATNIKTKQPVKPAGLGAAPLDVPADDDPRAALADWMTRKENPFFARALVNRYWKHFFGRGIVDPEDDMRDTNPPTNPELLDALTNRFTETNYDLKQLVRDVCRSTTYQLDAQPNEYNGIDRQNFSRYYPRRLNAEVLLDAVNQVTGSQTTFENLPPGTRAVQLPDNSYNAASYFLTVFGRPEASSSCECERSTAPSLAQSLHLLNNKELQTKVGAPEGRAATLAADARPDDEKLRELYLWAYARPPQTDELAAAKDYVQRAVTRGGTPVAGSPDEAARRKQAYEDLVWALVNTKEFSFNH